ncbi:MAG: hypothetical protein R6X35_15780 [Candidatus Krumholzibacteriia bacterium]
MNAIPVRRSLPLVLPIALALAGCSDSTTPPAPGIQPEIVNVTDSFEYQVQSVANYSKTVSYTWSNTGTVAAVDHSSVVSDGVGTLVVLAGDGTQVYSGTLSDSGSTSTAAGTAGDWTVRITYASFSGTVNFRVQKG